MKFVEVRVNKNTHTAGGLARRAACCKTGHPHPQESAMPTQPGRTQTDTTQPPAPSKPGAAPEQRPRQPGDKLVPSDTRPDNPDRKEPPVEDV